MTVEDMVERLPGIAVSLEAAGMDVRHFASAPPVSVDAVRDVEKALKHAVPGSFRRVLTEIAGGVDFCWFAPADWAFTGPFRHIFSGELAWSLDALPRLARDVREWIDVVFPDPDDPYDRVWHQKMPFMEIRNGDYLALDLADARHGAVVYLSHDDGSGHGLTMADSFEDLLQRWIPLACPGPEDWQWLPFHAAESGGIDPTTALAQDWIAELSL